MLLPRPYAGRSHGIIFLITSIVSVEVILQALAAKMAAAPCVEGRAGLFFFGARANARDRYKAQ